MQKLLRKPVEWTLSGAWRARQAIRRLAETMGRTEAWMVWTVLLIAAFAFFTYGASAGVTQTWYVDETFYDVYALQIAQRLFLHAPTALVPLHPSGYSMVLMVVYAAWYVVGRLTGQFADTADFLVRFAVHRGDFILLARWTSAAFATAALPGTYLTARRLFSPSVACVSTLALAVCYPMVFYAHIAANLTMLICLSAWTLYWIVRVWQEGSVRSYLAAGALIGAGIGTKYYPAAWFLSLALAHWYRIADAGAAVGRPLLLREAWKLVAAGLIALPIAVLLFPVPLLAPGHWRAEITNNLSYYTGGNVLTNVLTCLFGSVPVFENSTAEPVSWWSNSLTVLSPTGLAWILGGLAVGLVMLRRAAWLLVTPFLALFTFQMVRGGLGLGVRQLYFALPGLWIVAAAVLAEVCRRWGPTRLRASHLLIGASVVLLVQPVSWAARFLSLSSGPTTGEIARADLAHLIPAGALLLVDSMAAPYGETAEWRVGGVFQVDAAGGTDKAREARRRAAPAFEVRELRWTDAPGELRAAQERGQPTYIAVTDYFSTGYWHSDNLRAWGNINTSRAEAHRRYLQDLFDRTEIVRVYRPRDLHALGPTVTLLRLKSSQ